MSIDRSLGALSSAEPPSPNRPRSSWPAPPSWRGWGACGCGVAAAVRPEQHRHRDGRHSASPHHRG